MERPSPSDAQPDGISDEEMAFRLQTEELMLDHEEYPYSDPEDLPELLPIPRNPGLPRDPHFVPTSQSVPSARSITESISPLLTLAALNFIINGVPGARATTFPTGNQVSLLQAINLLGQAELLPEEGQGGEDDDPQSYSALLRLNEILPPVSKAANATQIDALLKDEKLYRAEMRDTQCSVCLENFVEGEKVIELPVCRHVYHVGCLQPWLQSDKICPYCRKDIFPPSFPSPSLP